MDGKMFILNQTISDPDWIYDWSMAREFVLPKLVNKSVLENIGQAPYGIYMADMVIVFVLEITVGNNTEFRFVNRQMVERWGIPDSELKEAASANVDDVAFFLVPERDYITKEREFVDELIACDEESAYGFFMAAGQNERELADVMVETLKSDCSVFYKYIREQMFGKTADIFREKLQEVEKWQTEVTHKTFPGKYLCCEPPYSGANALASSRTLVEILDREGVDHIILVPFGTNELFVVPVNNGDALDYLVPYYEGLLKGINSKKSRKNILSEEVFIYSRNKGLYIDIMMIFRP